MEIVGSQRVVRCCMELVLHPQGICGRPERKLSTDFKSDTDQNISVFIRVDPFLLHLIRGRFFIFTAARYGPATAPGSAPARHAAGCSR